MKKTDLLDLISYSDKRKDLLILLQEGPKTLDEIKTRLNVTATGMLPQIRKLEKRNLVQQVNKEYVLTDLGEIIVHYFNPLVKTLRVIEENEEFWSTHDLKAIPPHLLKRISEIKDCRLTKIELNSIYELRSEFVENLQNARKVSGIFPVYHPMHPSFFLKIAERGTGISLIYSRAVAERIKNENEALLRRYLELKNARFFISDIDLELASVTSDRFFCISLFLKDGDYDHQREIISFEPSAAKWGEELFKHYLKDTKQITKLIQL